MPMSRATSSHSLLIPPGNGRVGKALDFTPVIFFVITAEDIFYITSFFINVHNYQGECLVIIGHSNRCSSVTYHQIHKKSIGFADYCNYSMTWLCKRLDIDRLGL